MKVLTRVTVGIGRRTWSVESTFGTQRTAQLVKGRDKCGARLLRREPGEHLGWPAQSVRRVICRDEERLIGIGLLVTPLTALAW